MDCCRGDDGVTSLSGRDHWNGNVPLYVDAPQVHDVRNKADVMSDQLHGNFGIYRKEDVLRVSQRKLMRGGEVMRSHPPRTSTFGCVPDVL